MKAFSLPRCYVVEITCDYNCQAVNVVCKNMDMTRGEGELDVQSSMKARNDCKANDDEKQGCDEKQAQPSKEATFSPFDLGDPERL